MVIRIFDIMLALGIISLVHVLSLSPINLKFGKKLDGFVIRTVIETTLGKCLKECHSRDQCSSFNYIRSLHLCELNSEDTSYSKLSNAVIYVYGDGFQKVNTWLFIVIYFFLINMGTLYKIPY